MLLNIIGSKDARLRKESRPVSALDKKILKLISDMKETLVAQKDPEGVGLAAPQVGKNMQIFVVNYEDMKLRAFINPKIIEIAEKQKIERKDDKDILEGCLSIPHYYGPVSRSEWVKISYMDEKGKKKVEEFDGFVAHIIQHEIDHLHGRLFIDHILEHESPLYLIKGDEWEEVEL